MSENSNNHEDFLSSMTFAAGGGVCACDECGDEVRSAIPNDIRAAVRKHLYKRDLMKPNFDSSKRLMMMQQRVLLKRSNGFSVWKWILPASTRDTDNIMEYRNSHRIMFVKDLPKSSTVLSIGKGIVGSAAEEKSRKVVNWEQGSAYFYPCAKGQACGWIHRQERSKSDNQVCQSDELDSSKVNDVDSTVVTVYALKAPHDLNEGVKEEKSQWTELLREIFSHSILNYNILTSGIHGELQLSQDESSKINNIIKQLHLEN